MALDERGFMRLIARVGVRQLVLTRSLADSELTVLITMDSNFDMQCSEPVL